MKKVANAYISWVPAGKGGRKQPPSGPLYSTLVRFDDDTTWPHEAWSLVVRCLRSVESGRFWYAQVEFLVEEAPQDLLHSDSRFQLFEGRRMTATGIIVAPSVLPRDDAGEFEAMLLC